MLNSLSVIPSVPFAKNHHVVPVPTIFQQRWQVKLVEELFVFSSVDN